MVANPPHISIIIKVVTIMFPNPTKGETMPPNRNPEAPKTAEAVPICFLPLSMPQVDTDVKIIPRSSDITKVRPS